MATEIANAYIALTTKMPGLKKDAEAAFGETEGVAEKAGNASGTAWARNVAIGLAAGTVIVAAAATAMATKVVSAFAELEQNLGGSEAVFGEYASSVQKTGEEAYKNLGISQSEYLATANKMGALFQGSGVEQVRALDLTRDAMQRAADMASVMGIDMGMAMESVAGAAKGNFTMMDNLGVAMNATTIEAYAASKGMEDWSFATATSAEKAELAMGMFMENTSQYAGNYAREATETVSGSFGMLSAAWEELLTGLGNEDADMSRLTQNLGDAVEAVISNVAPIVANLFKSLPETVGQLFAAIGPVIDDFVASLDIEPLTVLYDTMKNIFTFIAENISWISALAAGIAAAAVVVGVYTAAMAVWTAYTTAAAAAQGGLTVAQWLLNTAMSANPIGLVVLAIGLLIGAIILLVQNWDTVVQFLTDVWNGFIGWITGVIDGFVGWWNGIWAGVAQWISDVWSGIVANVARFMIALQVGIQVVGNAISSWWNGLWSGVASFFTGIWNGILAAINNVKDAFSRVFTAIGDIIRGAFDGIVGFIKDVINGIIGAVNGAISGINGVVGAVGGVLGFSVQIPSIPKLADGGIVTGSSTGTLALVGEAGRGRDEAVIPLPPDWRQNGLGGGIRPGDRVVFEVEGQPLTAVAKRVVEDKAYRSSVAFTSGGVSA